MEPLTEFSNKHRFDEPELFKVYWDRWESQPQNVELINKEKDRLVSQGYAGDIHEKMYIQCFVAYLIILNIRVAMI